MSTRSRGPTENETVPLDAPDESLEELRLEHSLTERYARLAKEALKERSADPALRVLDVAIAGGSLLVLSPLLTAIALAIRATDGAPVLYRGRRVGRAGELFTMIKFRTLRNEAETRLGPYLGLELSRLTEDEVTSIGRVLRHTHLDEAPQLLNVLRGEMSVVGPRPIRPAFFETLCQGIPQYWQRLVVRPGMTGPAQTRMTRETSWEEKLAHDLEYIADRSVSLYLHVVWHTLLRLAGRLSRGLLSGHRPGD